MQDELFFMTNKLNLTVITRECAFANRYNATSDTWYGTRYPNGTHKLNGGMGMLQKREVDIVTYLMGVNLQRSEYVDFPIPTRKAHIRSTAGFTYQGIKCTDSLSSFRYYIELHSYLTE